MPTVSSSLSMTAGPKTQQCAAIHVCRHPASSGSIFRPACLALAAVCLLTIAAHVHADDEVLFRVPIEITDIHNLQQVTVDCLVSRSPLRAGPNDEVDLSRSATIRNRETIKPSDTGSDGDPATGDSWRGTLEVRLGDHENGDIRMTEGRQYLCKTTIGYTKDDPPSNGFSILRDGNCRNEVQFIDTYRDNTGADIAEHLLCRQGPFNASHDVVDVDAMYLRGGRPLAEQPIEDVFALTTLERRSKRVGPRFASFPHGGDIENCALACVRHRKCRSWSGWDTRGGRCFLSSNVPPSEPAEHSFSYSGRIKTADESSAEGGTEKDQEAATPAADTDTAIEQALEASEQGEDCRAAEILRPFLDDPTARAMHEKLRASCR